MLVSNLKARAAIVRKVRAYFDDRGFTEIETPVRIKAPAPEVHIDCPKSGNKFLRASPELQMKKLLAAGMDRIYNLGPCFREGENGSRHSEEFTMLEWYRLEADYTHIMNDMQALIRDLMRDERLETRVITVREAYRTYAGWDPFVEFDQDRFDYDMATKIEPNLRGWVFLKDYPPPCSSLSIVRNGVAERWELYHDGLELANCFTELCSEREQRERFAQARAERRQIGEADYPLDEEFLASLPLIKSASGVALGIDRLVMCLLGAKNIADVRVLD